MLDVSLTLKIFRDKKKSRNNMSPICWVLAGFPMENGYWHVYKVLMLRNAQQLINFNEN